MRTRLLLGLVTVMLAAGQSRAQKRTISDAEVMRVHRSTLLIDTHNDVPSRTVEGFDIGSQRVPATPISPASRKAASARNSSRSTWRRPT